MSIYYYFFPQITYHQDIPNYDILFGWCPKRKIHLQHATANQLLELDLISEAQWNEYFKFTFVRNPWDRAYSDYKWMKRFSGINGSFEEYIFMTGKFKGILNEKTKDYLGDHLLLQTDFFDFKGINKPDFIGRFESFTDDMRYIQSKLNLKAPFNIHENASKRKKNYSLFYTNYKMELVRNKFSSDINKLDYSFEDERRGFYSLKKLF